MSNVENDLNIFLRLHTIEGDCIPLPDTFRRRRRRGRGRGSSSGSRHRSRSGSGSRRRSGSGNRSGSWSRSSSRSGDDEAVIVAVVFGQGPKLSQYSIPGNNSL